MCGADPGHFPGNEESVGSSPRVRSRLYRPILISTPPGIISACAEQTRASEAPSRAYWDHLRVCGADNMTLIILCILTGSSPRVRSRLRLLKWGRGWLGIISACAEQTYQPANC